MPFHLPPPIEIRLFCVKQKTFEIFINLSGPNLKDVCLSEKQNVHCL
jgi:hypothetical protein